MAGTRDRVGILDEAGVPEETRDRIKVPAAAGQTREFRLNFTHRRQVPAGKRIG